MAVEVITFDANIDPFMKKMRQIGQAIDKVRKTNEKSAKSSVEASRRTSAATASASRQSVSAMKQESQQFKEVTISAKRLAQVKKALAIRSNAVAKSSKRSNFFMRELAFAADDAAQVFGTSGLAGSLRAAGNNLSFMAAMINPLAGALVGIGLGITTILIGQLKRGKEKIAETATAAKEATDRIKEMILELELLKAPEEQRPIIQEQRKAAKERKLAAEEVSKAEKRLSDAQLETERLRQARREVDKPFIRGEIDPFAAKRALALTQILGVRGTIGAIQLPGLLGGGRPGRALIEAFGGSIRTNVEIAREEEGNARIALSNARRRKTEANKLINQTLREKDVGRLADELIESRRERIEASIATGRRAGLGIRGLVEAGIAQIDPQNPQLTRLLEERLGRIIEPELRRPVPPFVPGLAEAEAKEKRVRGEIAEAKRRGGAEGIKARVREREELPDIKEELRLLREALEEANRLAEEQKRGFFNNPPGRNGNE